VANALDIELTEYEIQRVHRLGRKKKSAHTRPHPVIARFVSYQKRNEFMYAKKI